MAELKGTERAEYVQDMFSRIASRYDLMNRLMTFGQDLLWRKEVISSANLPEKGFLLDIGTGTGDLAREGLNQCKGCRVVAADFTLQMMLAGKISHEPQRNIHWLAADTLRLPVGDEVFDAVVSAFLLRNVSNLPHALAEQYRILKPGGKLVCLDTSPPPDGLTGTLARFHMHTVIPILGKLVSGNPEAYRYLPESTEAFLEPTQLVGRLEETGFHDVGYRQYMLNTVAIHWGTK